MGIFVPIPHTFQIVLKMSTYLVPFKIKLLLLLATTLHSPPCSWSALRPLSSLTPTSVSSAHQSRHLLSVFHFFGPVAVPLLVLLQRLPLVCPHGSLPLLTPHMGRCVHLIQSTASAQAAKAPSGIRAQCGTLR